MTKRFVSLAFVSTLFILATSWVAATYARSTGRLAPEVERHIASGSQDPVKVWVYFADHGESNAAELDVLISRVTLSERARQRRLNRSRAPLTDTHDLPVHRSYVRALQEAGCRVKHTSKYLNAVSAYATADQILAVRELAFVRRIARVQTAHRERLPVKKADTPVGAPSRRHGQRAPMLEYGPSLNQIDLINVVPLHDANVFGHGVLVAILDTGYNRSHESLIHLDILAEWDFVNDDPVTKNEPGDPSWQHNHGTATLSALGGYAPGSLIGPAWAASFALGKTEQVDVEIQQEEDDYVRGLEWADSLGAVIVSSSLGYYDWYGYEDMDGNTAVTTIAADIAAAKGIAVITAAGNEGPLPWPGIIAPSDGDSVIAVGGVEPGGTIWGASSRGPSYDQRIKPDVCAQSALVQAALASDSLGYYQPSGTSMATPLVAGAAALCLQMHPYWTPIDLRDSLRTWADHAATPNNDYGWGVIDAYQTALAGATGVPPRPPSVTSETVLFQNTPNPFVPSISGKTAIRFRIGDPGPSATAADPSVVARDVTVAIYDVSGRLIRRLFIGPKPPGDHTVEWDGLNDRGVEVSSSVYYYRLSVGHLSVSKKLVLIRR